MMVGFVTERIEENRALARMGTDAIPSTTGEVVAAMAEDAFVRNPTPSLFREARRSSMDAAGIRGEFDDDPTAPRLMEPDEANERFGIEGKLTFDRATTEAVAEELNQLKRDELRREDVFRRAQGGVGQWAARIGTGLAVSVLDPLNVASAFIPAVGPSRYALWLERAGSTLGRAGVRAGVGVAEGAIGAAVLEPLVLGVARSEQADYTMADSMLNIAFGSVLGGGLHAGFGALADRITGPLARQIDEMPLEAREGALRSAIAQVAEGRPVRVDPILDIEQARLRAAYDDVLASPLGPVNDPVVRLSPGDIEDVLVSRGPVMERDGEIVVQGRTLKREVGSERGFGLVKIIWRHGERSANDIPNQVTRDDVVALPQVIREYQPVSVRGEPGQEGYAREWRVERDGREITYATTRFNGESQTVTIYVERKAGKQLSEKKAAGSPDLLIRQGGDTAEGAFGRDPQSQPMRSVADDGGARNLAEDARRSALGLAKDTGQYVDPADLKVSQGLPPAPKSVNPEMAREQTAKDVDISVERVSQAIKEAQAAGRLTEGDLKVLSEADEMAKKADAVGRAAQAASACLAGRP